MLLMLRLLSMPSITSIRQNQAQALWYNVSFQCSYCDCQDLTSKCKHILGIQMIIEMHMPHLCGSLPFIEYMAQMQMEHRVEIEVETKVEPIEETNSTTSEMESRGVQITNGQRNYSMSQVRVRILRPCNYFGMYAIFWRLAILSNRFELDDWFEPDDWFELDD